MAAKQKSKAANAFSGTLSAGMLDVVRQNLDDLSLDWQEKDSAYEKAIIFSESMDGIAAHITEAVAGSANMGMVNETLLNMVSNAGQCLIEERSLDMFKARLGMQGHMLVTIGNLMEHGQTHQTNTRFLGLSKALKNWHDAILETNMALCAFNDLGNAIVDKIHAGAYGSFGTAGTGSSPAIDDLNEIRSHSELIYGATQKARFYQNIVEEKLSHYRAAIIGLQQATALTNEHDVTVSPEPQ